MKFKKYLEEAKVKSNKIIDKITHKHKGWVVFIGDKSYEVYKIDKKEAEREATKRHKSGKVSQPIKETRKKKIDPKLQKKIDKAAELGAKAFKDGKKSIPALDPKLQPLLKGLPVGKGAIEIIDAWTKAWHKENLK